MRIAPIAVLPLRAGSKGLPGKNTRLLAGKPLFTYSIAHARAAGIERVMISTDIPEVLAAQLGSDVTVTRRPEGLGADDTTMADVLRHVLSCEITGPATIVLLQATSPLRSPADICRAIDLHASGKYDLVMSVTPADSGVLKWGTAENGRFNALSNPEYCFANRGDLPSVYRPDGAIYVFDADWFRRVGAFSGGNIGVIITAPERAHDIDTTVDFEAVSDLIKSE